MPETTIMTTTRKRFSWFRWLCTVFGLLFYLADIGSDVLLSVQYFKDGHVTWAALTLVFVLAGSLCIQIFSYSWFKDDKENYGEDNKGLSTCHLIGIHVLQIGIFTRYGHLLKRSFKALRSDNTTDEEQFHLFGLATDLSMLRMFEMFLESVPQLVLQVYIILEHNHHSKLQYISMALSFLTIAWATVDYRRCFRRSLPNLKEMPSGIPTVVYLSYKIFTITPRILSLTLFIMLSSFNIVAVAFIWLVGTVWAFVEESDFCTSRVLEHLYRAIVGVILLFTFFNVKGENTKVHMTVYYIFNVGQNLAAPVLLYLFKPEYGGNDFFLPIIFFIFVSHSMGLGFLALYYSLLHPRQPCIEDQADGQNQEPKTTRSKHFLQI